MPTLSEFYPNRSLQSVRLNSGLLDVCRATGVPTSQIVEASLGYFATLTDEQKIVLLTKFDPDKLDVQEVYKPQMNLAQCATETAKRELGAQANSMPGKTILTVGLLLLGAAGLMAFANGNSDNPKGEDA